MATPAAPTEPVAFGSSVEALLARAAQGRMTDAVTKALKELNVDPAKIKVAYDYETWVKLQRALAGAFYPSVPLDQALDKLGQDYIHGLDLTVIGKGIRALARLGGPKKMLERMTRNVRTANNYMESELEPLADGSFRMHYRVVAALLETMRKRQPFSPSYFRGILAASLQVSGARDVDVVLESYDLEQRHAIYRVRFAA